jgi:hypothetical protein
MKNYNTRNINRSIIKRPKLTFYFKLLFVFILALSFACYRKTQKNNSDTESFYTIPFADIIKSQRQIKLSEVATDVEIIQLENTSEALLGTFENIELTKDFIFIQCWDQPVLQFSCTGKLIRTIGARGKGPGEYINCMKMSIDEQDERIYIQTVELTMMVFNFDGEYLKTIQFPALESMTNFWNWGRDSTLVSYFEPYLGNEPFVFIEHNEQGDTLQGISNYIFFDENERVDIPHFLPYNKQNYSYHFENKLYLKGAYNDTVYSYNEKNKFIPKFFIDLGKHKLPEKFVYERKWVRPLPADLCWTGVHEISDYVFIPYGYHFNQNKPESEIEEKGLVVYNKKTNVGVAIEETKQAGFIDDLTGGPDFRPSVTNDNTALMLLSALDMKQYLDSESFKNREVKFPAEKEKLVQLNKTLKEEDNHFVMLVKLKE